MYYDGKNLQDVQKSRENLIHYMGIAERTFEKSSPTSIPKKLTYNWEKLRCRTISFTLGHTQDMVMDL